MFFRGCWLHSQKTETSPSLSLNDAMIWSSLQWLCRQFECYIALLHIYFISRSGAKNRTTVKTYHRKSSVDVNCLTCFLRVFNNQVHPKMKKICHHVVTWWKLISKTVLRFHIDTALCSCRWADELCGVISCLILVVFFSCLAERCNAVSLWWSRSYLWTTKPSPLCE